eukprot:TRINITY_DN3004_c2_g1_i2.p1 TRINITY_DN3004_c2_g1~~TRINITY_DN3004_c2_g1_i2.p1  ORF type:complete len:557 (+),score=15.74 TRINITY_DN3004_c2_g1_i2:164-1834(+)
MPPIHDDEDLPSEPVHLFSNPIPVLGSPPQPVEESPHQPYHHSDAPQTSPLPRPPPPRVGRRRGDGSGSAASRGGSYVSEQESRKHRPPSPAARSQSQSSAGSIHDRLHGEASSLRQSRESPVRNFAISGEVQRSYVSGLRSDKAREDEFRHSQLGQQREKERTTSWRAWSSVPGRAYRENALFTSPMKFSRPPPEPEQRRPATPQKGGQPAWRPGSAVMGNAYAEAPLMTTDSCYFSQRRGSPISPYGSSDWVSSMRTDPKREQDFSGSSLAAERRKSGQTAWRAWDSRMGRAYEPPPLMTSPDKRQPSPQPRPRASPQRRERRTSASKSAASRSHSAPPSGAYPFWERLHVTRELQARRRAEKEARSLHVAQTTGSAPCVQSDARYRPGQSAQTSGYHLAGSTFGTAAYRPDGTTPATFALAERRQQRSPSKIRAGWGNAWEKLYEQGVSRRRSSADDGSQRRVRQRQEAERKRRGDSRRRTFGEPPVPASSVQSTPPDVAAAGDAQGDRFVLVQRQQGTGGGRPSDSSVTMLSPSHPVVHQSTVLDGAVAGSD